MKFDIETFVSEGATLAGKNCGWIRENIQDLHIVHVHDKIGEVLERKNPPDDLVIQPDCYIQATGTKEATSKLVDLAVPSSK